MLQAARADAVGSLLVFLYLLECEPERVAELEVGYGSAPRRRESSVEEESTRRVVD
jgi:hypothetical protein